MSSFSKKPVDTGGDAMSNIPCKLLAIPFGGRECDLSPLCLIADTLSNPLCMLQPSGGHSVPPARSCGCETLFPVRGLGKKCASDCSIHCTNAGFWKRRERTNTEFHSLWADIADSGSAMPTKTGLPPFPDKYSAGSSKHARKRKSNLS